MVIGVESVEVGFTPNAIAKPTMSVSRPFESIVEIYSMLIPFTTRMGSPKALSLYIEEVISWGIYRKYEYN